MVSTLTQLLIDVDQLPPSERKIKLVASVLSHFRGDQIVALKHFLQELDEKLEVFQIVPRDYALLLHASESLSWAMEVLETSPHPVIITTAVDIVGKAWRKDPYALKNIFGAEGSKNLIQLINTALPRYATTRLFRLFGTVPRVSSAHSSTGVDDILQAIFPFLSTDQPTPLSRYARSAVVVLFIAGAPSIVMDIVRRCAAWFNEGTWKRLAESRPELVEEIILHQVGPSQTISHAPDDIVANKRWNKVILWSLLRHRKDNTFFTQFLDHYVSRTLEDTDVPDVFGAHRSSRSTVLFEFMAFILRKRTHPDKVLPTAIDFCETVTKLVDAGACDEWTWDTACPFLEIACYEFGKSPNEWTLAKMKVSTTRSYTPNATGLLLAIFTKQMYPTTTFELPDSKLIHLLRRLPLPARLPFLNLLYITKTSESLIETPTNRSMYPRWSAFLLSLLYPLHGRTLLEVGTKARGELFISSQTRYSRTKLYDFSILPIVDDTSPMLFANWSGIGQSVLGDNTTELGQAEDATIREVESYKKRAMRSRDDRPNLVTTALLLSVLSRSPSLFVDTFMWTIKRYAKDPETSPAILNWVTGDGQYIVDFLSGPVGLYASHRTRSKLTKNTLLAWCTKTNETFSLLVELLSVWVSEPGFMSIMEQRHELVGLLLFKVVKGRVALIDKVFPVLLDDLVGLGDVLLSPLVEHWIKWERFKVQMHPNILGFNAIHCVPCKSYGTIAVHLRILSVVFPFMEKLGFEREQLYRSGRLGLPNKSITVESRRQQLLEGVRHILPFELTVTGMGKTNTSCRGIHLPDKLFAYVKRIVLPEDLSATLDEQDDKLDWHPSQFSAALESYLAYSKDEREIDDKIHRLLLRYGPSDSQRDFRTVILRSDIVQSSLWVREALNGQVCSWLPEFPASDSSQDIDFDPPTLMPPALGRTNIMVALREPKEDEEAVLRTFLSPFKRHNLSISGASTNTSRRLAVLVVAWILTVLKVPRIVSTEIADAPIHYAIQKVRLSKEFLIIYENSFAVGHSHLDRSLFPCHLLPLVLPFISLREVDDFARAVFSADKTPISEAVLIVLLGAMRHLGIPHLTINQAFHILQDVEASSRHRQTITTGTINACTPLAAENLTLRLLTYTQERHRQQMDRRKTEPKGEVSKGSGPLLKMSTHKMVMQLLQTIVQHGSIDASFVERSADAGLLEVPPAIRSYVVDVLAGIVQDSFVIGRRGTGKWDVLLPFIAAAQRLSEDIPFSGEQWTAAQAGEIPMPDIVEERHVAASLLSVDTTSMPSSLKRVWAENVVDPIITGHVKARTMWLQTAVAREGGSSDLKASISATNGRMPVLSSFTAFAPYLPATQRSLLQILEHSALAFLARRPCQELRDLVDKNHPAGWEHKPYGKNVMQLTAYAVLDATDSGSSTMTALVAILTKPNVPSSLVEDVTSSIRRIGSTLLHPDNMSIHANLKAVVPFASFTRFITVCLAPPNKDSLDPKIITLLGDFLTLAEGFQRQKSMESLNGGACYWRVIIILKLLSLRIATDMPTGDSSDAGQWIQTRARQLGQLAKDVADGGWYHVHFPHGFEHYLRLPRVEDVVPVCRALTQAPNCPSETGWLRALCFDTAVTLLRAKQNAIVASPAVLQQLSGLKEIWQDDQDGSVGWLSLSWHDHRV